MAAVVERVKQSAKTALSKTPYKWPVLVPTMAPGAPRAARAVDALRRWRVSEQTVADLERSMPPTDMEIHRPCPLCGHDGVRVRFSPRYRTPHGWARYRAGHCAGCGLLYRVPAIKPGRVPELYTDGTYAEFLEGDYADTRQTRYRLVLDAFSPRFDDGAGRTVLDFGCGTGLFLELAVQRGFDVYGVDLAPDALRIAGDRLGHERLAVTPDELLTRSSVPRTFDLVTMWSVLAHIAEPLRHMREMRDLVTPGGDLVIFTVNSQSLQRYAYASKWNGFTKNHLVFWDEDNLRRLMREAGFSQIDFRPFYGMTDEIRHLFPERLHRRHEAAVDRWGGGNMLAAVATN